MWRMLDGGSTIMARRWKNQGPSFEGGYGECFVRAECVEGVLMDGPRGDGKAYA